MNLSWFAYVAGYVCRKCVSVQLFTVKTLLFPEIYRWIHISWHRTTQPRTVSFSYREVSLGRSRRADLCQCKVSEWHICISKPFGYSSDIHELKTEFRDGLCKLHMGCHSFDILANCMLSYLIFVFVVSPSLSLVACHMAVRFSSPVSGTNETITRISQWLMPLTCQPARQAR